MRVRKSIGRSSASALELLEGRICMSESLSGVPSLNLDTNNAAASGVVNNLNSDDLFRIHLSKAGTVAVKLTGLTGDATLELIADTNKNNCFDSGEVVSRSALTGTKDESVRQLLDAGFYFVRVSQANRGVTAKYKLTANVVTFATPDVKDSVGDDAKTAKSIDPKPKTDLTLTEYIGGKDTADVYRWDVKSACSANIRLNGLVFDADVTLYQDLNHNGKIDANEKVASTVGKTLSDKLISGRLNAGTYFLSVTAVNPAKPTTYSLRISPSGVTSTLPLLAAKI